MGATQINLKPFLSKMPLTKFAAVAKSVESAVDDWQAKMKSAMRVEPSYTRGTTKWVSERQRRYVMAQIRKGAIRTPHQRSGDLAASWRSDRRSQSGGLVSRVWSDHPRARYIVGLDQARRSSNLHAQGWRTVQAVQNFNRQHIQSVIVDIAKGKPRRSIQIRRP